MTHTALILASRRQGVVDPLAAEAGVSHKCLIDMDGAPMIERVIVSLRDAKSVGDIVISIDDPAVLDRVTAVREGVEAGVIRFAPARENLWLSVRDALSGAVEFPALICTADNALQTAEMVDHFTAACAADGCEIGVAVTAAETIWSKYPEGQRRPHRFRDGMWSNCNLFALRSPAAIGAARAFEGGGQFGKSKKRVLKAFGLLNLILYMTKLYTLRGTFARVSKRFGISIKPIEMPWPEAPIDVDNERTQRIAREILVARRMDAAA
ncbi:MAG: nucleotidyltransferase family protein [Pseudomonadota bacterium]